MATSRDEVRPKEGSLGESSAFVVHVGWTLPNAGCHGRVEHVSTGLASRFGSAAELLAFMQATLGRGPGCDDDETAAPAGSKTANTPPGGTS
jgi:hypothetical protein